MAVETREAFPRKQLLAELFVVLAAIYLPLICAGISEFLGVYRRSDSRAAEAIQTIMILGQIALIIYMMRSRGEPLSKFGFTSLKFSDLIWMLSIVLFNWVLVIGLSIVARPLDHLPGAHVAFAHHFEISLWVAPAFYLAGSFFEEILWRSYAFTRLVQMGLKPIYAVLLCAALFASYHIYQGWAVVPIVFMVGLGFGLYFLKFRRLWPLVIGHAIYNFLLYLIYQGMGSP